MVIYHSLLYVYQTVHAHDWYSHQGGSVDALLETVAGAETELFFWLDFDGIWIGFSWHLLFYGIYWEVFPIKNGGNYCTMALYHHFVGWIGRISFTMGISWRYNRYDWIWSRKQRDITGDSPEVDTPEPFDCTTKIGTPCSDKLRYWRNLGELWNIMVRGMQLGIIQRY